jgi:peptide/nickel transport system substrate-binding protein
MHSFLRSTLVGSFCLVAVGAALAGCAGADQPDLSITPGFPAATEQTVAVPTPMPPPPTSLIVCLAGEPASLYLYSPLRVYGEASRESDAVLQAIYDGPIDVRGYAYQPVILEKLPSLADGDARLEPVVVREGDLYLNPETLLPDQLAEGSPYLPTDCADLTCAQTYTGGEVSMDRMAADFHLRADVLWSDGQTVTATDSVYSYQLNADPATLISKYVIDRTASYEAIDDRTVRWTGIPGFLDAEYASNFWSPLPEHVLRGMSAAEILEAEEANRLPIGWGPYIIDEWRPGDQIRLHRNPSYFRAGEGLPRFDYLTFRFLGDQSGSALQQLLTGECDVLDESALAGQDLATILGLEQSGGIRLVSVAGPLLERMDFNLAPVGEGSWLLADGDTRRAVLACIDRQGIVDDLLGGLGQVTDTYLPPDHPLFDAEVVGVTFDPAAASAQLEQMGWVDEDGSPETPRVARGVAGVRVGTPLSFGYLTSEGALQEAVADRIREDLARCGVGMETQLLPDADLMQPWPDGPVFGRTFQSVGWDWLTSVGPACESFASREIPSEDYPYGSNASGFSDPEYDAACASLLLGYPELDTYRTAVRLTQSLFADRLPALPLFVLPRLAASRPDLCGLEVDASAYSVLWNIEAFGEGDACAGG